jgi:redox-sensing transcriptional repressor
VAAGITSILNFAPVVLNVPEGVDVRKVDLSIELQILAFHEQRKGGGHALDRSGADGAAGAAAPGGRAVDSAPDHAGEGHRDPSMNAAANDDTGISGAAGAGGHGAKLTGAAGRDGRRALA